jgi:hypothetical protein
MAAGKLGKEGFRTTLYGAIPSRASRAQERAAVTDLKLQVTLSLAGGNTAAIPPITPTWQQRA